MKSLFKKINDFFTRPTTKFLQEQEKSNHAFFKMVEDVKSNSFEDAKTSVIAGMLAAVR